MFEQTHGILQGLLGSEELYKVCAICYRTKGLRFSIESMFRLDDESSKVLGQMMCDERIHETSSWFYIPLTPQNAEDGMTGSLKFLSPGVVPLDPSTLVATAVVIDNLIVVVPGRGRCPRACVKLGPEDEDKGE